jgi:hypothetical protein
MLPYFLRYSHVWILNSIASLGWSKNGLWMLTCIESCIRGWLQETSLPANVDNDPIDFHLFGTHRTDTGANRLRHPRSSPGIDDP